MNLHRESADSIERLYEDGRLSKREVTQWCRLSAKLSGRVFVPRYRAGAAHDHLSLVRKEKLEDRLFAKRAGYWKGRDQSRLDAALLEVERAWRSMYRFKHGNTHAIERHLPTRSRNRLHEVMQHAVDLGATNDQLSAAMDRAGGTMGPGRRTQENRRRYAKGSR